MHYVHTDHLGSLNVITNQSGAVEQELSFDAWGNRRNPDTWANLTGSPTGLITRRGYTGHEHMDEFGIINMNGRLYDPVLGRFLSPDPIVANTGSTQDYNRYSYVVNNPLMFTDPSGYIKYSDAAPLDDIMPYAGSFDIGLLLYGKSSGGGGDSFGSNGIFPRMGVGGAPQNSFEYDLMLAMNVDAQEGGTFFANNIVTMANNGLYSKKDIFSSRFIKTRVQSIPLNTYSYSKRTTEDSDGNVITYLVKKYTTGVIGVREYYLAPVPSGGGAPNYTNRVGGLDYAGYVVDGTGYAAELTAKGTYQFGRRVNGKVVSAAQLTRQNAALWGKVAAKLNVAGGIVGVFDSGFQSYEDFSNGNYALGAYEATKGASYLVGTAMLFSPLAPIGAGILLVTGIVDIAGDVGLYIYGRNQ